MFFNFSPVHKRSVLFNQRFNIIGTIYETICSGFHTELQLLFHLPPFLDGSVGALIGFNAFRLPSWALLEPFSYGARGASGEVPVMLGSEQMRQWLWQCALPGHAQWLRQCATTYESVFSVHALCNAPL